MTAKPVFRRFIRILLIVIGVHAVIFLGLHIWFVNNARGVLKQIVSEKSGGELKLKLSRLSFDFLSNKLQIREAELESKDNFTQPATYHVKFRKLTLRIHSFWPLIFQKKLLLDSIKLHDPVVTIMLLRKDTTSKLPKDDLSVPQEMGKLYNSMLDVLDGFGIRRIIINNASLSLINKIKPDAKPVTISNIYLEVVRTAGNLQKRDDFVANEQSVDLITTNQNIDLPGGRHRLSFKTFRLHLFRKHIQLDSCTIIARSTASSKSSYKIFFAKLLLIGVDFNAMYRDNIIRADSVYCENPSFNINLVVADSTSKKKERPNPEKIIRELTGDLDLAFVGVKDAGIHININGNKPRTLINSSKDNFEMRGLLIDADSSVPVAVQQFDMLVRDYRLYNEDSSTAYSFDSVTFKNNKIVLNNFSVITNSDRYTQRSQRNYRIPYFELTGLDWHKLVFDETLEAREAVLYNPVINYSRVLPSVRRKKENLFVSLQNLDNLITLGKINIIHGQVNMKFGPSNSFNFHDVNLSIHSDKLLKSRNEEGLRRAIEYFSFSKGLLQLKDITAQLMNIRYTGSNLIHADKLVISSKTNKIRASVNDVYIDNMLMDDEAGTIVVDGMRWKNASVELISPAVPIKNKRSPNIHLKNISGNNTQFSFLNNKTALSGFVQSLKISSLTKTHNQPVRVSGFLLEGNNLSMNNGPLLLKTGPYQLSGEGASSIYKVQAERIDQRDSLSVKLPRISFSADMNEILAGNMHLMNVQADEVDIDIRKWNTEKMTANDSVQKPDIRIDRIIASQPDIHIATHRNDSVTIINIPRSEKSIVKASDFMMNNDGIKLGSISVNTNAATFIKEGGETIGVEKGTVAMELSNVHFSNKAGKPFWSGMINNLYLQNPRSLTLGKSKNKLILEELALGNLRLSSDYLADFNQMVTFNVSAWLRAATGHYIDSTTTIKWYNAGYDNASKTLSLDSFSYYPTQPRDSVIANTPYQIDYITFHSGAIQFTGFNLEKYKTDSSFIANSINITKPDITIYRDKQPPFLSGIIKPLPVNLVRRISFPVSVSRVNIIDGRLSYTEKNAKSGAEGTVFLTNLNGGLSNIKNRNLVDKDSLGLALNAYLMDSASIELRVKESYTDTLSGFLMTLRMKPTSLSFLNPVLVPLSNVVITSGSVDSFHLRAIGRENLAVGEMKMYYHGLRIKLVKPGDPDQATFKNKLITFIANTFIIKKNNKGRTGLVYFERLRDRSFFNYIIKMTFSGLATSVGFKKNNKYRRQYERELKNKNLPPINF